VEVDPRDTVRLGTLVKFLKQLQFDKTIPEEKQTLLAQLREKLMQRQHLLLDEAAKTKTK
jgi:hypothetical protein